MKPRYPDIRERLKAAARALSDERFQERLWLLGQRESNRELGFDDTLLVFVDELEMFGPGDLVGNVLIDEREQRSLEAVQDAVRELIDRIGTQGSFEDAVASGEAWNRCKNRAAEFERELKAQDETA